MPHSLANPIPRAIAHARQVQSADILDRETMECLVILADECDDRTARSTIQIMREDAGLSQELDNECDSLQESCTAARKERDAALSDLYNCKERTVESLLRAYKAIRPLAASVFEARWRPQKPIFEELDALLEDLHEAIEEL